LIKGFYAHAHANDLLIKEGQEISIFGILNPFFLTFGELKTFKISYFSKFQIFN
jgi:hypothetical protein